MKCPIAFHSWPESMRMSARRFLALLMLLVGAVAAHAAERRTADVILFAASSLQESLDEQAAVFSGRTGLRIAISYFGSSALARQIERGAPADVFISADLDWMDYLQRRKLLQPGSRVNLLSGRLVLIAPAKSAVALTIEPGFAIVQALGDGRLAMADPRSVPAGKYGKAALTALGVWQAVEKKILGAENVRAALAFVARGEAPLGIVYRTDALAETAVRVVGEFPATSHPEIVYPAAIVSGRNTPGASALLRYLASRDARPVWKKHGFSTPD